MSAATLIGESLVSLAKVMLHPRRATVKAAARRRPLMVLGNGPSLTQTLADHAEALRACDLLAVNFAANTPIFAQLRPSHYVLADPHFFLHASDPNVAALIAALNAATWPMTLYVPFGAQPAITNPNITIARFPTTGAEGLPAIERLLYSARLAMPRPRNVLIPSIMIGAWAGYTQIYIAGADHSWMKTISVNERNEVVSIQPHFYSEDSEELSRIRVDYLHRPLHSVVQSWYVAFRAYHQIQRWATARGIAIYNSTPESFIDAFPRCTPPTPQQ